MLIRIPLPSLEPSLGIQRLSTYSKHSSRAIPVFVHCLAITVRERHFSRLGHSLCRLDEGH